MKKARAVRRSPRREPPAPGGKPPADRPRHSIYAGAVQKLAFPAGSTVILRQISGLPFASGRCTVRGGSEAERVPAGGTAHLLEHLIATEIAERLRGAGRGVLRRARTTREHTSFSWNALSGDVPASLGVVLETLLSAGALLGRFEAERAVVLEEIERHAADPRNRLHESFVENAFDRHPIRFPITGRAEAVAALQAADLEDYARRLYTAANLQIVLVGDFSSEDVLATAAPVLGSAGSAGPFALGEWGREEERTHLRRFLLRFEGPIPPSVVVGFRVLDGGEQDARALLALAEAMARNPGVPRRDLGLRPADELSANVYQDACGAGWFSLLVTGESIDSQALEAAAQRWIERWRNEDPALLSWLDSATGAGAGGDGHELRAAIDLTGEWIDTLFATEGVESIVDDLADGEAGKGDPLAVVHRRLGLAMTRGVDVAAALRRHAEPGNWLVGAIVGTRPARSAAPRARSLSPSEVIETLTLDNGVRLAHLPVRGGMASCVAMTLAGSLVDRPGREGLGHLLTTVMADSSCSRLRALADQIRAEPGAELYPFSDESFSGIALTRRDTALGEALPLLAQLALEPSFSPMALDRWRQRTQLRLERHPPRGIETARLLLKANLFPSHPYGLPELGTTDSLASVSLADLEAAHADCWVAENLIVVLAGPPGGGLLATLGELFSRVPRGGFEVPAASRSTAAGPRRIVWSGARTNGSHLALGFQGFGWQPRGWAAAEMARTLLAGPDSSGMGSRLPRALRALGCAYEVQCLHQAGPVEGYFALLASCGKADPLRVEETMLDELARLRQGELADSDLLTCRKLMRLERILLGEKPRSLAYFAGRQALLSGAADEWGAIDADLGAVEIEDLVQLSAHLLDPDRRTTVLVQPSFQASSLQSTFAERPEA